MGFLLFFFASIFAQKYTLEQPDDLHAFLSSDNSNSEFQIQFQNHGTLRFCTSSRNHQTPIQGVVTIDGEQQVSMVGLDAWNLYGVICDTPDDFQITVTETYFSGHVDLNGEQHVITEGTPRQLVKKEVETYEDDESAELVQMERQMLALDANEQFTIEALNAGQLDVFVHVDIHDSLAQRFPGANLAAKRNAVTNYMLGLMCWINENIYFDSGFNLQVSGISHRSASLATTPDSSEYLYALSAEPRKSNAHLVYHATAERLGGGVAWLRGLYSNGRRGQGLCGSMSGNMNFWDRMCTAHEIGHNVGGPHTHDVGIDTCGTVCTQGGTTPAYLTSTKYGTIMSYCHLCRGGLGGSKNVKYEFHSQMLTDHMHRAHTRYQASINPVAPGTKAISQCNVGPATTTTQTPTNPPETTQSANGVQFERVGGTQYLAGDSCGFRELGEANPQFGACTNTHVRMLLCGGRTACTASGITSAATCAAAVAGRTECAGVFDSWSDAIVGSSGFGRCSCLLQGKTMQTTASQYYYTYRITSAGPATTQTPIAAGYTRRIQGCVLGANIQLYPGQSVAQCANRCNADTDCVAFEYGVNYGGQNTVYNARDCQLQNNANWRGCDGGAWNLDLYTKNGNTPGSVALVGTDPTKAPTATPKNCKVENSDQQCQFPFVYKGGLYFGCITLDSPNGKPWCATYQVGSQLEWEMCNMSSECTEVDVVTTQSPELAIVESAYEMAVNVDSAAWQFCSQDSGDMEWAQQRCNADPSCVYLFKTDCGSDSQIRFCSGDYNSLPEGNTQACALKRKIPESLYCGDLSDERTCTHILASDKCAEFGSQCEATCKRCEQRLEDESETSGVVGISFAFAFLSTLLF